jgi:hypothetical protein
MIDWSGEEPITAAAAAAAAAGAAAGGFAAASGKGYVSSHMTHVDWLTTGNVASVATPHMLFSLRASIK